MAQVPSYGGHQVMPTILGYKPVSEEIPKVQKADIEGAFSRTSDKLDKFYTKFLEEQDESRITAALTDLRRKAVDMETGEGGWASQLGENALAPDDDGVGLIERSDRGLQEYGNKLIEKFTPRQQRLFNKGAQGIYQSAYAGVSQHVYRQSVEQKKAAQEGAIAQAVEAGATQVGKPDALLQNEKVIVASAHRLAEFLGWTPENTEVYVRKNTSAMYMNGIGALMAGSDKNPAVAYQALGVLQANSKRMLASDVARARQLINPVVQAHEDRMKVENFLRTVDATGGTIAGGFGKFVASGVITEDAASTASAYESVLSAVSHGGQQSVITKEGTPDRWKFGGSQLTIEQAMAAAKEGGPPWDEKAFLTDRDYNQVIGLTRFNAMVREFAGDEDKAVAGYLTSPEVVREAEEKAKKEGGTWAQFLPKKTQDTMAVAARNRRETKQVLDTATGKRISGFSPNYAAASRKWPTIDEIRAHFVETDPRAAKDPSYCDTLVAKAYAQVGQRKASYTQEQNNTKAEALDALFQSHGDLSKVPTSIMQRLDVNEVIDLTRIAKRYQTDSFASNPLTLGKLSDDEYLVSLPMAELKLNLAELNLDDRKRILTRWALLKQKEGRALDARAGALRDADLGKAHSDFVVESGTVRQILRRDPKFKKLMDDHPDAAGVMLDAIQEELSLQGQRAGQKLNDVDVTKRVWAATREVASVSGFFGNTDRPAVLLQVKDLPNMGNTDAMRILKATAKAELQARGLEREPSDEELQYTLTKVMLGGNRLRVVVPPDVSFDNSLMREIRGEWEKKHGGQPMPMNQQIRYYFMARAEGRYGVPDKAETNGFNNIYMEIGE